MTRVVFMGTPDFAVPSLQALIDGGYDVVGVVTQPDREKGRGKKVQAPPVKELALAQGLLVAQPERIRGKAFRGWLAERAPELVVVTAYGKILPQSVLDAPRYGCLNVHASLLPKYRGAAPIQWALIEGERETGVSIMRMDAGMDTGDVIAMRALAIEEGDTAGSLHDKLARLGAELLREILPGWLEGSRTAVPQDHEGATMAPMLTRAHGALDWSGSAQSINDRIRGVTPWPGARRLRWARAEALPRASAGRAERSGTTGRDRARRFDARRRNGRRVAGTTRDSARRATPNARRRIPARLCAAGGSTLRARGGW